MPVTTFCTKMNPIFVSNFSTMQANYYLDKPNIDGKCPIYLQVVSNKQKIKYFFKEFKVPPTEWNKETKQVSKRVEGWNAINARLNKYKSEIDLELLKLDTAPEPTELKKLITKIITGKEPEIVIETKNTFFGYVDDFIHRSQIGTRKTSTGSSIADSTTKIYITLRYILKAYEAEHNCKLSFENIDLDFFSSFMNYLQATKKYKQNTIYKHIRSLKTIMREAYEAEKHTNIKFMNSSFTASTENTTQIYLNEMELMELYKLDLHNNHRLDKIRDLFIIECHTAMRYSDLYQIKKENITKSGKDLFLNYTQQKTKKDVAVPLSDISINILKKYDYNIPPPPSNQKYNAYLKELCQMLPSLHRMERIEYTKGGKKSFETIEKYKLVSSHTGRRSFATNANKLGHITSDIMAITGHTTEKSFFKYIRTTKDEKAKQFKLRDTELRNQNII